MISLKGENYCDVFQSPSTRAPFAGEFACSVRFLLAIDTFRNECDMRDESEGYKTWFGSDKRIIREDYIGSTEGFLKY